MGSVFYHLRDTLPFVAGVQSLLKADGYPALQVLPASVFRRHIWPLKPGHNLTIPYPQLPRPKRNPLAERLWSFRHNYSEPTKIKHVTCRNRETGYRNHVVFDEVEYGLEGAAGKLSPQLTITTVDNVTATLPLTPEFLHSRWLACGGHMGKGKHQLWPLEMYLDWGLVVAFAFQLSKDGKVLPYQARPGDSGEAALAEMLRTHKPLDERHNRWAARAEVGDFLPTRIRNKGGVVGRVGETVKVAANLRRVLVALSFSTMRERNDFEPGGIVGFAKVFPHLMVRAGVELTDVKGSVRVKRPSRTTQLDHGKGNSPASCCGAQPEIRSLLVADSNDNMPGLRLGHAPFWSGLFSWYEVNPDKRLAGQRLHIVNAAKEARRVVSPCGVRELPRMLSRYTKAVKMPRQGEFDNIHLAPQLTLAASLLVTGRVSRAPQRMGEDAQVAEIQTAPIDAKRMKLDAIPMAPFCSHDCLHTHWRWSFDDTAPWSLGWGRAWGRVQSPYTERGAPQVAPNQDVFLRTDGSNGYIYSVHAHKVGDKTIEPLAWTVIFHHGAAYAQGVVDWRKGIGSLLSGSMEFASRVSVAAGAAAFQDAKGNELNSSNHVPVFYWALRYYPKQDSDGHWYAADRLKISTAEVDKARKA